MLSVFRLKAALVIAFIYGTMPAVVMAATIPSSTPVGIFESHGDVGAVLHPGSAAFDAAKQTYTVSGSGENMWFKTDAYHFVWKEVTGDIALAADISFLGEGKNPHRKGCLIVRQSLDGDRL